MACGTCGGGRAASSRGLWVLTTPDGKVKTYTTEAEAKRVQTRLGGTVTRKN